MEFRAFFRQIPSSPQLAAVAEEKLTACVQKYAVRPTKVHVTFALDRPLAHRVSCHATGAGGVSVQVESVDGLSFASALDALEAKLAARLRRHKERRQAHKGPGLRVQGVFASFHNLWTPDEPVDAAYVLSGERARRAAAGAATPGGVG